MRIIFMFVDNIRSNKCIYLEKKEKKSTIKWFYLITFVKKKPSIISGLNFKFSFKTSGFIANLPTCRTYNLLTAQTHTHTQRLHSILTAKCAN